MGEAQLPQDGRRQNEGIEIRLAHTLVETVDGISERQPRLDPEAVLGVVGLGVVTAAAINSSYQPDHFTVDPTHNRGFVRTGSTGSLVRLNLNTMTEEFRRPIPEIYPGFPVHTNAGVVDPDGNLFTLAKFRDVRTLQKFASVHASLFNHFNTDRHLNRRDIFKHSRSAALVAWRELAA